MQPEPNPDALPPARPISDPLAGMNVKGALAAGLQPEQWEPPQPAELAAVLPEYQISTIIGRGGMGAIYKARDLELERSVAIKLLPPELSGRPDLVERFSREARALARLDHPNIVKIYDFGRTKAGHLYFVMEFVDGLDLGRILRSRDQDGPPQDHGATLEIISQICDALQYAHSKGIIHRDIKPANVLLSKEGHVKVADFGLARATAPEDGSTGLMDHEPVTLSGMVMGTLEYMAPEQQEGMAVDHRADIYAVGVLFYQMLTGHLPRGAFLPPSRKTTYVDARLDRVVLKALQSEPVERYQRASELRDAVQALVKLKTPAPPRASRARPEPAAERRSWPIAMPRKLWGGLTGAGLIALSIYGITHRNVPSPPAGPPVESIVLREAIPAAQTVTDGIYEVALPPGRVLPLKSFYHLQGQPLQLTFSAPGYQPQTLTVTPGGSSPEVRLEPVTAAFTWKSDPADWFSGARLVRDNPPEDPRLEAVLDLTPGTRKVPVGAYALSGLWGQTVIPLEALTISGKSTEARLKWPWPAEFQWTGVMDLNPRPVLIGLTALYQNAAAAWSVPVAVPFLLDFQPGGNAVLRVLNPQIMQLALLAIMGGSLPENQLEDEAAVSALFQSKVIHPLSSQNTSPTRLGQWFDALWKEQSRTPLARSGDARRAQVFVQFREQVAFLTAILTAGDASAAMADSQHRNFLPVFFDTIPLRAEPGDAPELRLFNSDRTITLTAGWTGENAEFSGPGNPSLVLKLR